MSSPKNVFAGGLTMLAKDNCFQCSFRGLSECDCTKVAIQPRPSFNILMPPEIWDKPISFSPPPTIPSSSPSPAPQQEDVIFVEERKTTTTTTTTTTTGWWKEKFDYKAAAESCSSKSFWESWEKAKRKPPRKPRSTKSRTHLRNAPPAEAGSVSICAPVSRRHGAGAAVVKRQSPPSIPEETTGPAKGSFSPPKSRRTYFARQKRQKLQQMMDDD